MKLGIGIDTGGTYTDAVLYDFEQRAVLHSAKSRTTHSDLTVGILGALDQLPLELSQKAELISLSTTLATNACVEDQTGRCKLIFLGGIPHVIDQYGPKYGLPLASEMLIPECHTTFDGELDPNMDWDAFRASLSGAFQDLDGVGIVEQFAMKNGGAVEKEARAIFREESDLPVVCGYEISSQLNCLQRGAAALLNAGLFSVIKPFLAAIREAMEQRGIHGEVVIVRSDGSLMSEDFARLHPVETLLCGPAASALGGCALSGAADTIIVDMGGTTTDIALTRDHRPVLSEDGVRVGKWNPCVDGLYIKTFGLGGDTAIHYHEGHLILEEYRVIPLCVLASRYPYVLDTLRQLEEDEIRHTRFLHEHYLLNRSIEGSARYTEEEQTLCRALADGPLSLRDAADAVGKDLYTLKPERLLKEGVIQLCGLTPTDIMHLRGEFDRFDAEASRLAASFVARNLDLTVEELCSAVYEQVEKRMYINIVRALLEQKDPHYRKDGISPVLDRFIEESYALARSGDSGGLLSVSFRTDFTLLGIGAPTHVFLPRVAALLGAKAVIPPHAEVANALGAIVGNVDATAAVEVRPSFSLDSPTVYTVFAEEENRSFDSREEAEAFAQAEACRLAEAKARRRGAKGNLAVTCTVAPHMAPTAGPTLYLGARATAHAVGSLGYGG